MADRWTDDRDGRDRDWRDRRYERNGEAYGGREDRSFRPQDDEIARNDRRPVFGERESGVSYGGPAMRGQGYTGPRYGAGGYTGYGERPGYGDRYDAGDRSGPERRYGGSGRTSYGARDSGADIYQERRPAQSGGRFYGDYGQKIYREESGEYGPDYSARGRERDANSAPQDYWEFGFGYDVFGRDQAATNAPRREYQRDYGGDDRGRRGFFDFGRDRQDTHRGRGPQGYTRSDERISDDVHDRLTEDPHLDASTVSVTVKDGEVTLSGTVDDRHAKHHAEHIVEDLPGVKHVQNNLRVEDRSAARGATTSAETPLGENSKLSDQAAGKA